MEGDFFETLEQYKHAMIYRREINVSLQFVDDYHEIKKLLQDEIYGSEVGDIINSDDLCDFIIWNGESYVTDFLNNPSSIIYLEKIMHNSSEFNGIINPIYPLIYIR